MPFAMATTTTRTRTSSTTSFNWKPTTTDRGTRLSPEEREQKIRETAYYIAERDSFRGDPISYWCEAEREINNKY
jgi:hypothetical protein